MLSRFLIVAAALWASVAFSSAHAQPIVTADPGRYATEFSDRMSVGGVAPLRVLYNEMFANASLPANIEAALLTYERGITNPRALRSEVVEDIALSQSYRAIYTYAYYGSNSWIFVRLDFVRIGADEWALSAASFGSEWNSVAIAATPSFVSNRGNRR